MSKELLPRAEEYTVTFDITTTAEALVMVDGSQVNSSVPLIDLLRTDSFLLIVGKPRTNLTFEVSYTLHRESLIPEPEQRVDLTPLVSAWLGTILSVLCVALVLVVACCQYKTASKQEGFKYVRRNRMCSCCRKKVKIGKVVMFQQDLDDIKEILELSKQQALDRTLEHLKATAKIDCNDSFFGMDEYKKHVNPDDDMEYSKFTLASNPEFPKKIKDLERYYGDGPGADMVLFNDNFSGGQ